MLKTNQIESIRVWPRFLAQCALIISVASFSGAGCYEGWSEKVSPFPRIFVLF